MALILAIETDRRQVSKLAILARNYLHEEIVVTDSIGRALAILDERLPDLILTSFQLQPKHRAALLDRLLEIDTDGTRVQTLVIPAMGAPGCRASHQKGMPTRPHGMRGNHAVADGCDPAVFGRQIAECLARIPADRRSAPSHGLASSVSPMSSEPGSRDAETRAGNELPTPLRAVAAAAPEPAPPSRLARPEWRDLLSTIQHDLERMRAETEPSRDTTPMETPTPAPRDEGPQRIRRRTTPAPAQDAWGVFDPQEREIAAMFAYVNENTAMRKTPAKKSA
jgi:hypothetical protein